MDNFNMCMLLKADITKYNNCSFSVLCWYLHNFVVFNFHISKYIIYINVYRYKCVFICIYTYMHVNDLAICLLVLVCFIYLLLSTWHKLDLPEKKEPQLRNASIRLDCRQACSIFFISVDLGRPHPLWVGSHLSTWGREKAGCKPVSTVFPWPLLQFLPWVSSLAFLNGLQHEVSQPNKSFPP